MLKFLCYNDDIKVKPVWPHPCPWSVAMDGIILFLEREGIPYEFIRNRK